MSSNMKILLLIVETSSLPLLILTLTMIISGYDILHPVLIENLTFKTINYSKALMIHTNPLIRICFTLTALIHGFTGSIILVEKYIRKSSIKKILEYIIIFTTSYLITIITITEIIHLFR